MNKKKEKDLYTIKEDNSKKRDNIITLIMIIFLILAGLSLIASYIFSILMKNPSIMENQHNLFSILHKASFILIIVCSIINAILLFVLIMLSPQETDYNKYKDYIFISKKDIKSYKKEFNTREKELKEEIKSLKNELQNKTK